ncbi:hypothetical protein D3C87_1817480 [compost metagenome]
MEARSWLRFGIVRRPLLTAEASAILMLTSTSEEFTPAELSIASELQRPPESE